uniref:RING-type domain-containing protein n=1 Tax=viral metagenome TaxID=1070528 RepID=A0A6C0EZB5_9ZZZZ
MENRQRRNHNNTNTNTNNISFNNPDRGYSSRHSTYDNAFNMDFEYGYLDLMTNFGTFISRTQEVYSNMESCMSLIIETQTERRRLINIRRSRRNNNMMQHLVGNDDNDNHNDNDNDNHNDNDNDNDNNNDDDNNDDDNNDDDNNDDDDNINNDLVDSHASHASHPTHESTRGVQNPSANINTNTNPRRDLFDIASVVYSIPRTVLLNPDTTSNNRSNRRRNGGLTIAEIEENTEILSYNSILSNDILNTECPITRETFTPLSVVLRLKQCKHCFVPFRMMTWLETHATCPLCRCNVIQNTTNTQAEVNNTPNVTPQTSNNPTRDTNTNINISNLFNNLIRSGSDDFNNLSIDNVNDNSIVFSFDMPSTGLPSQNNINSTFLPQIERLMENMSNMSNMYNMYTAPVANVAPVAPIAPVPPTTAPATSSDSNTPDTPSNTTNNNFNYDDYPDVD